MGGCIDDEGALMPGSLGARAACQWPVVERRAVLVSWLFDAMDFFSDQKTANMNWLSRREKEVEPDLLSRGQSEATPLQKQDRTRVTSFGGIR